MGGSIKPIPGLGAGAKPLIGGGTKPLMGGKPYKPPIIPLNQGLPQNAYG
jgi:hypothetical protein